MDGKSFKSKCLLGTEEDKVTAKEGESDLKYSLLIGREEETRSISKGPFKTNGIFLSGTALPSHSVTEQQNEFFTGRLSIVISQLYGENILNN